MTQAPYSTNVRAVADRLVKTFPNLSSTSNVDYVEIDHHGSTKPYESLRFGLTFHTGPLDATSLLGRNQNTKSDFLGDAPGETFSFAGELDGIRTNLDVRASPLQLAIGSLSVHEALATDDRQVYRKYRHLVENTQRAYQSDEVGLHLFFWENHSHLALTTRTSDAQNGHETWHRRYVMIVRSKKMQEVGQVDFTFRVSLPLNDPANRIRFSKLCGYFDSIAKSLSYDAQAYDSVEGSIAVLSRIGAVTITLLAIAAQNGNAIPGVVGWPIVAILVADFANATLNRSLRRMNLIYSLHFAAFGSRRGYDTKEARREFERLCGVFVSLLQCVGDGAYLPASLAIIIVGAVDQIQDVYYWAYCAVVIYFTGSVCRLHSFNASTNYFSDTSRFLIGVPQIRADSNLTKPSSEAPKVIDSLRWEERLWMFCAFQVLSSIFILGMWFTKFDAVTGAISATACAMLITGLGASVRRPSIGAFSSRRDRTTKDAEKTREIAQSFLNSAQQTNQFSHASRAIQWGIRTFQLLSEKEVDSPRYSAEVEFEADPQTIAAKTFVVDAARLFICLSTIRSGRSEGRPTDKLLESLVVDCVKSSEKPNQD